MGQRPELYVISHLSISAHLSYRLSFGIGTSVQRADSQQSAVSNQQSAVSSQQSAVRSLQSAVCSQQSAVSSQQSAVSSQQSSVLVTLPASSFNWFPHTQVVPNVAAYSLRRVGTISLAIGLSGARIAAGGASSYVWRIKFSKSNFVSCGAKDTRW